MSMMSVSVKRLVSARSRTRPPLSSPVRYYKRTLEGIPEIFRGEDGASFSWMQDVAAQKSTIKPGVCIIGGGIIGCCTAYWLKYLRYPLDIVIVERDHTYARASTPLSWGGIRQQFSTKENILLSLESYKFLSELQLYLKESALVEQEPPNIGFNPQGYMILSTEEGLSTLTDNLSTQRRLGAKVDLLDHNQLRSRFPWLNTEGIVAATLGLENEGWFDPWLLLSVMRKELTLSGVRFIKGLADDFDLTKDEEASSRLNDSIYHIDRLKVRCEDGVGEFFVSPEDTFVNCAGAWSGSLIHKINKKLPKNDPILPVPVEPRKRSVFAIHAPDGPGIDFPALIDVSGFYIRREGLNGYYLTGWTPQSEDQEPDHSNLEVDYNVFDEKIWPQLSHRIPAFEKLKVKSAWAGYYDYNHFDQNNIIGLHHNLTNMMLATGFSGHGIQQAPAVGRAVAEFIVEGKYTTVDVTRMSLLRFLEDKPLLETEII